MNFIPFPSIEGLHNVVKSTANFLAVDPPLQWPYKDYAGPQLQHGSIKYRGKIKLHGTNAGIRLANGEVAAQSRSQLIDVKNDNAGFARWVENNRDYWQSIANIALLTGEDLTVFGEWCGPGIMKGTAIQQIPNKIFAVFAVIQNGKLISEPFMIDFLLGKRPADVHILPWHADSFVVHFDNRGHLESVARDLGGMIVNDVEPVDPWVKQVFGVEGVGEGIVYYPGAGEAHPVEFFSNFAFKAKGEKHKVTKTKEVVQVDPEVAASVEQFVQMFVTEARLEQGLAFVGTAEGKNIPAFLKWFAADVMKESKDEMEASGLTWDKVQKQVQFTARNWFLAKVRAV